MDPRPTLTLETEATRVLSLNKKITRYVFALAAGHCCAISQCATTNTWVDKFRTGQFNQFATAQLPLISGRHPRGSPQEAAVRKAKFGGAR